MNDYINFLNKNYNDHIDLLEDYTKIGTNLLFQDESIVKEVILKLESNIIDWATKNSSVYNLHYAKDKIFTRQELNDQSIWNVASLMNESESWGTSGSSTGQPFQYKVWNRFKDFLRNDNHWSLILDEYDLLKRKIKICILYKFRNSNDIFKDSADKFFYSDHFVSIQSQYNHGSSNKSIDYINFNNYNHTDWYNKLFNYLDMTNIDVIISTGPIINELCNQIRKRNYSKKICRLLSHSNEFPLQKDFKFLKEKELIDYHCDHMRCWDGGASFFTCKYEVYHLLDNVTLHKEIDNKLKKKSPRPQVTSSEASGAAMGTVDNTAVFFISPASDVKEEVLRYYEINKRSPSISKN